jgi:PhzF family phenazine biosynthesis protein
MRRRFLQVDVFSSTPYRGNPVAVVLDGEGLSDRQMQVFARWTNLSETTFVLPATTAAADYRVRIFTGTRELPFAGHPTIGTCHAWLQAGGGSSAAGASGDPGAGAHGAAQVVQECGAGLVRVRRERGGLAFAAPALVRAGPVEEVLQRRIAGVLGIDREAILDAEWTDNGPGWVAVLLADARAVLALAPGSVGELKIGVVGPYPPGGEVAVEVRAFVGGPGGTVEDPVTGSLNAALAPWLARTGRVRLPYTAGQGTALGRTGRVGLALDSCGDGTLWVGGSSVTCVDGHVDL